MNQTKTYLKLKDKARTNYPTMIIVHHSGGTDKYPLMDTSNHTAAMMEEWHLSNGWEGLGYHYVIHKDGEIWLGRPEHYHGSHCVGHNSDSIGICLAGNFDLTLPTQAQIDSLIKILKSIKERYNIKEIVPHRKFSNKTCYGKNLSDTWASDLIKEEVVILPKELLENNKTSMEEMKKYSFKKGILKAVISLVLFAIPFMISNFPDIANLTIGSVLMLVYNWIKVSTTKI